ncbi:MAG: PEP-CTERM sorting domain-containing protein [Verrucomicrobiales bacterium]
MNTGLDDAGAVLADNDLDTHWELLPAGATEPMQPVVLTSTGGFPVGPWLGDSVDSTWLSYSEDSNGPPINYEFSTPFSLQGLDVGTVNIMGRWSSDNLGVDILINGVSTGQTNEAQFGDWSDFSISSAEGHQFNQGENTLTFLVNNAPPNDNPIGFRAEFTVAEADVIPEPSVGLLFLLGVCSVGLLRRR